MIDPEQYTTLEGEVYKADTPQEMIRLSGTLLARVDESLRQRVNAHEPCELECRMLARACALHLDLLLHASESAEVYATALTALLMLDMAGHDSAGCRLPEVFELVAEATIAFSDLAARMPDDEFTREHIPAMYQLWGSWLYDMYQRCDKPAVPLPHLLQAAHSILTNMIEQDMIVWPQIQINGTAVDVGSTAVLSDIIGRSVALGIFK